MLQNLVHHLGRFQLAAELARDGAHDGFEDGADPFMRADLLILGRTDIVAEGVHVVEQAPGLVLLSVNACQAQQAALVVSGVDHLGLELDGGAVGGGLDGVFLDIEAELVQAANAGTDSPAVLEFERFLLGQLGPQAAVAFHDELAGGHGVHFFLNESAFKQIHEFPGNVDAGNLKIIFALAR